MSAEVLAYPWNDLPAVSRRAVRRARAIREALGEMLVPERLADALASVLRVGVRIVIRKVAPSNAPPSPEQSIHFSTADASVQASLAPEAALVSALLAKVLARPVPLVDPSAALDPSLRGALAALCLEAARRTPDAPGFVASNEPSDSTDGVAVDATLFLDERPYVVRAWAALGAIPTGSAPRAPRLGDLGDLPLSVPVVVAASTALPGEVSNLSSGDTWLPGDGCFYRASGNPDVRALLRRAILAAPSAEYGIEVGHSEDGRIVLLGSVVALAADASDPRHGGGDPNMSEQRNTLDGVLLDAPVVVRIEVGTVTRSAREWAAMRPGDVLETGLRIAEPVVLRIAGREVARGELVNVDGELGVRISELTAPGHSQ